MIVVDIETSGIDFLKSGIFQIGGLDSDNLQNTFFGECRIDYDDITTEESLRITGRDEGYLRDSSKISQKELLETFFEWCRTCKIKTLLCHNPQFDFAFLKAKAEKYDLRLPFGFICLDTHSIASIRYFQANKRFLIIDDHSGMSLGSIIRFCGMEDRRREHNALEDARLTAECYSRLVYGKGLLSEYEIYPVPERLRITN